jgi:hypothetical protein
MASLPPAVLNAFLEKGDTLHHQAEPAHDLEEAPPPRVAPERVHAARSRRLGGWMVLAAFIGMSAGAGLAWHSNHKAFGAARASIEHVDHEVRVLRVDDDKTQGELSRQATELARQAADLASTKEALANVEKAQKAAEAKAEARSARIAQDVADLAERTRRAQAKTDAQVFKLDEALKLIDWATTTGMIHDVVDESHTEAATKRHAPR